MIDVNKPVSNPELVAAMEELQRDPTPERESRFFELIKAAHVLMVLEGGLQHGETPKDGTITLKQGTTIQFPIVSDPQGRSYHIAFTDWPSLYSWRHKPDEQTLITDIDDIAQMVLHEGSNYDGVIFNLGSHNFPISRELLAYLTGRSRPVSVEKETQVLIGVPAEYPRELADAVKHALKPLKEVKQAWLLLMSKDGEQSYLIVVDFTGDRRTVSDTIGRAALPHLKSGFYVDIVPASEDFGAGAVKNHKPFYKRGLF